ncbi:hypothetical protein [Paraburkholderia rhynchosiae]|uniref:hypothetical protein n=1 Tax=Paraburkholderia rhynchosiae TaxID=487049 RepID=UPI001304BB7A|nr:hypothetical protein [Paraburkholderia rhynchosiae]
MSFMLILEADPRLSEADVRATLSSCGVDELVERDNGFEGNFPSSNMFFLFA